MYADTTDMLCRLMTEHPDTSPSAFLRDDSLAGRLYDEATSRELKSMFNRDADDAVCAQYGLTRGEWREQVSMALEARREVDRRRKRAERAR